MGETVYRRTLGEYKAAFKAAFGPINKQRVLREAAKDKELSTAELVALTNWARRQGVTLPEGRAADEGG